MAKYLAKKNTLASWMMFFRGVFAVALGIALLVQPDVVRPFLVNFIGAFWISGGMLSIRWGIQSEHSKQITMLVGLIGIVAGASVMGRKIAVHWIDPEFMVMMLGVVALLTGLLHVSGQMSVRHAVSQRMSRTGVVLGIVEIILGLILVFHLESSSIAYVVLVGWALLGGFALLNDARLMRQETLATIAVDELKRNKTDGGNDARSGEEYEDS